MEQFSLCTRESFEEVMRHYSSMVYRLAFLRTGNTSDAEDITQEVFLKYICADKIYNDEEHRKAWLIRITINCSKTLLTSAWNRHRSGDEISETEGCKDKQLEAVETNTVVYNAVLSLPQKYRTVVQLFYFEQLQINTISEIIGVSETAVRSQLHRARNLLKKKLEGVEFDEF